MTQNTIETIRLLVVSREPAVLRLLGHLEESNSWHLETAASGWDAMERLQSGTTSQLLVLDLPRGDADGLHFLRWLRRLRPGLPVILLCHTDDAARGKEATCRGAGELIVKPFEADKLEYSIRRQLGSPRSGDWDIARKNIEALGQDIFFVSASLIMQKLRAQAALLAKTDVPVLIAGETGSGKCTVASLIHQLSVRSGFKLLRVNCAEMPEAVLEVELFGASGVSSPRRTSLGQFAAGEKGTIFLEEITEMPAALQSRLLQVLQEQEAHTPVGTDAVPPDVRILAASSANLDRALAEKQLREDLYYRLSAFTVHVPPLRQRKDEIPILLSYFMHKLAKHYSLPARGFSSAVLDACQRYSWPGNLKELEAFVKRYLVAGEQELAPAETASNAAGGNRVDSALLRPQRVASTPLEGSGLGKNSRPESLKSLIQGIKSEAERNAIGVALTKTGWNRKAAARLLRVSYRTLLYKIEQYHMRASEPFLAPVPSGDLLEYEVKGSGKAS